MSSGAALTQPYKSGGVSINCRTAGSGDRSVGPLAQLSAKTQNSGGARLASPLWMPRYRSRPLLATVSALAALGSLVAVAASTLGGTIPGPLPIFPRDNWWNLDVSTAPIDPSSASYITFVGLTRAMHPDFGGDVSPGGAQVYGFPYAIVRTVTLEAAVRQDRFDVEVEIDDVGQSRDGRCGGPPAATARHHGQCEHNGTRGQMPKDQRDCHPGSEGQEADYRTLTPGRGALEDEVNDPAPTSSASRRRMRPACRSDVEAGSFLLVVECTPPEPSTVFQSA